MNILIIFLLELTALVIPGLDFTIVTRYSIRYGRQSGILCALGIGVGNLCTMLITYVIMVMVQNIWHGLYLMIIGIGVLYLLYFSVQLIKSNIGFAFNNVTSNSAIILEQQINQLDNNNKPIITGIITNISNPKAIIFFSSLIPLIENLTFVAKCLVWVATGIESFMWYAIVALLFSNKIIRKKFLSNINTFEIIIGFVIIIFTCFIIYNVLHNNSI